MNTARILERVSTYTKRTLCYRMRLFLAAPSSEIWKLLSLFRNL